MRINDLINNGEFSFNFPFRIYRFLGGPDAEDPDEMELIYESDPKSGVPYDIPYHIGQKWISAINEGDDGVMEIEFVDLIGEEI